MIRATDNIENKATKSSESSNNSGVDSQSNTGDETQLPISMANSSASLPTGSSASNPSNHSSELYSFFQSLYSSTVGVSKSAVLSPEEQQQQHPWKKRLRCGLSLEIPNSSSLSFQEGSANEENGCSSSQVFLPRPNPSPSTVLPFSSTSPSTVTNAESVSINNNSLNSPYPCCHSIPLSNPLPPSNTPGTNIIPTIKESVKAISPSPFEIGSSSSLSGPQASAEVRFSEMAQTLGYPVNSAKSAAQEYHRISSEKDFSCPICRQVIKEAFMTFCGHSFCYLCIMSSLEGSSDCPVCKSFLRRDLIFPNFLLDSLLQKLIPEASRSRKVVTEQQPMMRSLWGGNSVISSSSPHDSPLTEVRNWFCSAFSDEGTLNLIRCLGSGSPDALLTDPSNLDKLLNQLLQKKKELDAYQSLIEDRVLLDFLSRAKVKKLAVLASLHKDIEFLDHDISFLLEKTKMSSTSLIGVNDESGQGSTVKTSASCNNVLSEPQVPEDNPKVLLPLSTSASRKRSIDEINGVVDPPCLTSSSNNEAIFANVSTTPTSSSLWTQEAYLKKKRKMSFHFNDLQSCYFDNRESTSDVSSLEDFRAKLIKCSRYSRLKTLASIKCGDIMNPSSIISSIEFDKNEEYFATGGVTRCIKIYDYASILEDSLDVHYPVLDISCQHKLSCLSWNSYLKNTLACSDYEGVVTVWDVNRALATLSLSEHEKRTWSVDFSPSDPMKLASGSDDTRVKVWSLNQKNSCLTIETKANICCVQFNPTKSNFLAFGSADHYLHYYDLRNASKPYELYKGHKKAISYVRFLNSNEIISASTDSTLKLWDLNGTNSAVNNNDSGSGPTASSSNNSPVRTFSGHSNERNFVGLTSNEGEYIACGSETNSIFVYYKCLSNPIMTYKFGTSNPFTGEDIASDDLNQFVSSVSWRQSSNTLVSANSQGTIKILEPI